jgi:hypothetical protein
MVNSDIEIHTREVQKVIKSHWVPHQSGKKMDKDDLQHCFSYLWYYIIVVCVYKSVDWYPDLPIP